MPPWVQVFVDKRDTLAGQLFDTRLERIRNIQRFRCFVSQVPNGALPARLGTY